MNRKMENSSMQAHIANHMENSLLEVEHLRQMKKQKSTIFHKNMGINPLENGPDDDIDYTPLEADLYEDYYGLNCLQSIKKVCATIFITLEIPRSSSTAKIVAIIINIIILTAIIGYIASTELSLRISPTTCNFPACDNDPTLCPGYQICPDDTSIQFLTIDDICTYLFTIEYGLRLFTCWSVPPRVAGIILNKWKMQHRYDDDVIQPTFSLLNTLFRFVFKFKNLVDLASILPSYVGYAIGSGEQTGKPLPFSYSRP
jgi:hypothetical protein